MPARVLPATCFLLALLFAAPPAEAQPAAERTLLHCGTVIDPATAMEPQSERTVVVEDGRVTAVEAGFSAAAAGEEVVDLRAAHCLPGLIDSHTHITSETTPDRLLRSVTLSVPQRTLAATQYARRTLLAGFTTVRDVGGDAGMDLALRDAIDQGHVAGPRIFAAGTSLAITGGHGDPTNAFRHDLFGMPTEEDGVVDGVASARRGARHAVKQGADLIKITATGGVLSVARDGSSPQFFEDEIAAIVDVADGFGLKVTAHAHGDEGMQRAIRAGISAIEHGTYMSAETMQMMREDGVYLVPTITAGQSVADSARIEGYFPPVVRDKALEVGPEIQHMFARAYEAGVPIAFGTDAGVFRHGRNATEFEYMVEAGMPMIEALRAATVDAARLLDRFDELGSLEPGKRADVIAVAQDPLQDPTALQEVSFVMKDGVIYKQNDRPTPALSGAW